MLEQIEIEVISPKKCRFLIPKNIYEELSLLVKTKELGSFISGALKEELKRLRFRKDIKKSIKKIRSNPSH